MAGSSPIWFSSTSLISLYLSNFYLKFYLHIHSRHVLHKKLIEYFFLTPLVQEMSLYFSELLDFLSKKIFLINILILFDLVLKILSKPFLSKISLFFSPISVGIGRMLQVIILEFMFKSAIELLSLPPLHESPDRYHLLTYIITFLNSFSLFFQLIIFYFL